MKKVVILGASGHAHVIADIVTACGDVVEAFLDDDLTITDASGLISEYVNYQGCEYVIGIGNTMVRMKLSSLPIKWYTAIHPSAVISPSAQIGEGSVIMPNAVINARSVVGKHCIVNTGAVVEHDNTIDDYSHVSVGAKLGGMVHIGESTWIGIGASINNNLEICKECMIGAGTVVIENIDESGTYVGIPAKRVK